MDCECGKHIILALGKLIKYEDIYVTHQSSTGISTTDGEHFRQINDAREVIIDTHLDDEEEAESGPVIIQLS